MNKIVKNVTPFILIGVLFTFCGKKKTYPTKVALTAAYIECVQTNDSESFRELIHPYVLKKLSKDQKELLNFLIPQVVRRPIPSDYEIVYAPYNEATMGLQGEGLQEVTENFIKKPTEVVNIVSKESTRILFLVNDNGKWNLTLMIPDDEETKQLLDIYRKANEGQ
jgi:hypothetical protein